MVRSDYGDRLWDTTAAEQIAISSLDRDLRVDLAIVGAGFTGCSAALEAAASGASVAVLEARSIGHGGSGRNVGLVNAGLWLPPDAIVARLGEAVGERLISALAEAPSRVFSLVETHGIACDARRSGTLHCAHAPGALTDLENRARQGNRHGAPVRLLDAQETRRRTGAAGLHGALFDPRAGTLDPLAYCRGLARAAQEAGSHLFAPSPVQSIGREREQWVLRSGRHAVHAKALLVATNAYHEGLMAAPYAPQFVTVSYSQFATDTLPDAALARILPGGEGCWDTARVMSSFRLDASGRLILGGIGNLEGPGRRIHQAWARRKLSALFPQLAGTPFRHAWRGKIAMTRDHVLKLVAFGPDALACFGYSGRGIGPGTVFGAAAARALLTADEAALPIPPIRRYAEGFTSLRATYYEFGATLTHSLRQRRPLDSLPLQTANKRREE